MWSLYDSTPFVVVKQFITSHNGVYRYQSPQFRKTRISRQLHQFVLKAVRARDSRKKAVFFVKQSGQLKQKKYTGALDLGLSR